MPVTQINIAQGKPKKYLRQLMDTVHRVLVDTLRLPEDDKNMRLQEFDPELFDAKKPYEIFIEVSMFPGRSKQCKKQLYTSMVQQLQTDLSIEPTTVFIILYEPPMENWGIRGGQSAEDVVLGFNIHL